MNKSLIIEIDRFLRRTGMAPSRLGRLAINDPRFVSDVRNGRKVYGETADKVRQFMAANKAA